MNFDLKISKENSAGSFLRPGQQDERRALQFLEGKGFNFLAANQRVHRVEIDLIVRSPKDEICLIEVKSLQSEAYVERRVTPAQMRRIRFVLRALLERNLSARAHLVFVGKVQIEFVEDFFVRGL